MVCPKLPRVGEFKNLSSFVDQIKLPGCRYKDTTADGPYFLAGFPVVSKICLFS
jgi:hypothetical protein